MRQSTEQADTDLIYKYNFGCITNIGFVCIASAWSWKQVVLYCWLPSMSGNGIIFWWFILVFMVNWKWININTPVWPSVAMHPTSRPSFSTASNAWIKAAFSALTALPTDELCTTTDLQTFPVSCFKYYHFIKVFIKYHQLLYQLGEMRFKLWFAVNLHVNFVADFWMCIPFYAIHYCTAKLGCSKFTNSGDECKSVVAYIVDEHVVAIASWMPWRVKTAISGKCNRLS